MDDDPGEADDEKIIELSSIAAIFPELVVDSQNPHAASLDLEVSPATPLRIAFQQAVDSAPPVLPTPPVSTHQDDDTKGVPKERTEVGPSTAGNTDTHELSHLPALSLHISLPEKYPREQAPNVRLSSHPPWIPQDSLKILTEDCTRLWEGLGKDHVVYTYIDHLQQAAERAFGLAGNGRGNVRLSSDMKLALMDFDLKRKRELFEKETFDCGICLEPKKGFNCHRLMLCGHVFCVTCLQDFYNNCIQEGDVDNVKCLTPDCGTETRTGRATSETTSNTLTRKRQDRTLNPSELLQIPIEPEVVQRYVRLKRKKRLEADQNTIYCPRQWCQGAARSKKHPKPVDPLNDALGGVSDSETEVEAELATESAQKQKKQKPEDIPMSERLAVCEDCDFAFCCVCKKGWHGELSICNPRRQGELNEEEKASAEYLKRYTTGCPTCNAPAQKTMGCNHMICFKCKTHFCYLCSSYLMPENPYKHFNELKSACYMRLWELEAGDGDNVGIGYAGGEQANWDDASVDEDSDGSLGSLDEDNDDFINFAEDTDDDEDSDEEPAPDQRRPERRQPLQIEIVNAAGRRIIHNLPVRPEVAEPPPAAPAPPQRPNRRGRGRGRGRGQPANHHQRRANEAQRFDEALQRAAHNAQANMPAPRPARLPLPPFAHPDPPEDPDPADQADPDQGFDLYHAAVRVPAAPGQGNAAAQQPAPVRAMGLERFLELAQRDEEDEWDSDELDEDEGDDGHEEVDVHQPRLIRRQRRVVEW